MVDNRVALSDLDLPTSISRTICELCQSNPALLRYEVFSTKSLATGSCCPVCFPDVLRALPRGSETSKR